ncbi:hypothetical protein H9P43_000601 [Blastocladiella emersonii ATCC 22665]|nr:hypothetical protein H9P43_000601 [Blastocladiella emersonii ATCC 22665]
MTAATPPSTTLRSAAARSKEHPPVPSSQGLSHFLADMLGDLNVYDESPTPLLHNATLDFGDHNDAWGEGGCDSELETLVGMYSDASDHAEREGRRRAKVIQELVSSESTYHNMLAALIHHVVRPLRESVQTKRPVLSAQDVGCLFSNVEHIYAVHTTLIEAFQERMGVWHTKQFISDVLMGVFPYLYAYKAYVINYGSALRLLETRVQDSPEFARFVSECQRHPALCGLTLDAYLILPVQRIPRYVLLLERVLQHTTPDHPDYHPLLDCLAAMRELGNDLDHAVLDHQARLQVAAVQMQLLAGTSDPDRVRAVRGLVHPARRFVFRGTIQTSPNAPAAAGSGLPSPPPSASATQASPTSSLPLIEPLRKKKSSANLKKAFMRDASGPPPSPRRPSLTVTGHSRRPSTGSGSGSCDERDGSVSPDPVRVPHVAIRDLAQVVDALPDHVHLILFSDLLVLARDLGGDRFEYLCQVDLRMARLMSSPALAPRELTEGAGPRPRRPSDLLARRINQQLSPITTTSSSPTALSAPPTLATIHLLITSVAAAGTAFLDVRFFTRSADVDHAWHHHLARTLDALNVGMAHTAGASVTTDPTILSVRRVRSRNPSSSSNLGSASPPSPRPVHGRRRAPSAPEKYHHHADSSDRAVPYPSPVTPTYATAAPPPPPSPVGPMPPSAAHTRRVGLTHHISVDALTGSSASVRTTSLHPAAAAAILVRAVRLHDPNDVAGMLHSDARSLKTIILDQCTIDWPRLLALTFPDTVTAIHIGSIWLDTIPSSCSGVSVLDLAHAVLDYLPVTPPHRTQQQVLLFSSLPKWLKSFDFSGHRLTDDAVRALALWLPRGLEVLVLSKCHLSEHAAQHLISRLPSTLRQLGLSTDTVGGAVGALLASHVPRLEQLILDRDFVVKAAEALLASVMAASLCVPGS